jgi:hypothetical protein
MTADDAALIEIRQRFAKLEKQNRRLKRLGAAALVAAASLALLGQAPAKRTVEANEFILRDGAGKVRARLAMHEKLGTPQLLLFDDKGNESIGLTAGFEGDKVNLTDGSKAPERYGGSVDIFDGQGREREMLQANDLDGGEVMIGGFADFDKRGVTQVRAGSISIFDSNVHETLLSPGSVVVNDAQGFQATLGAQELATPRTGETHRTSAASLVLFDKDKNVIWRAP